MRPIDLDVAVDPAQQGEVLKQLYWVDSAVRRVAFAADDPRRLLVEADGPWPGALAGALKAAAEDIGRALALLPARTVYAREAREAAGAEAAFAELVRRGWVNPLGEGFFAHSGPMAALLRGLDAALRLAGTELGACEFQYPSLITVSDLSRAGYLANFPQHANFVCHLPEQSDAIRAFRERVSGAAPAILAECGKGLAAPEAALCPTVCYPCYVGLSGRDISGGMHAATASSRCFRFESRSTTGLRRLREFAMREIIFVGQEAGVRERREALLKLAIGLLERFDLSARIETASDPFFMDGAEQRRVFQLGFEMKHEIRVRFSGEPEPLAIGSVNYHADHFGRAFDIRAGGVAAHSCCAGFGLERWCLALFARHGFDPAGWPPTMRALVDEGGPRR